MDRIEFEPSGVCCHKMTIQIKDGIIQDVEFEGGCSGNLGGIRKLIKGMKISDVIERLDGTPCGLKLTSCPDQLARCLKQYAKGDNK